MTLAYRVLVPKSWHVSVLGCGTALNTEFTRISSSVTENNNVQYFSHRKRSTFSKTNFSVVDKRRRRPRHLEDFDLKFEKESRTKESSPNYDKSDSPIITKSILPKRSKHNEKSRAIPTNRFKYTSYKNHPDEVQQSLDHESESNYGSPDLGQPGYAHNSPIGDKEELYHDTDLLRNDQFNTPSLRSNSWDQPLKYKPPVLSGKGKRDNRSRPGPKNLPKVREEILFGLHPVLLALQERRRTCYNLYIKPDLIDSSKDVIQNIMKLTSSADVRVNSCSREVLDALSGYRPHQGVCLDASRLSYYTFEENEISSYTAVRKHQNPQLWLLLDSVKDPMNFGAILRSCYYFGVDRIFTLKKNSCALSPVVSKASAGVLELQPVYTIQNILTFIKQIKERDWTVIGSTAPSAECEDRIPVVPVHQFSITSNTLLLLGNEGEGLMREVIQQCHHLVTVPPITKLHTGVDSLNVSVATGILLHALQSSRHTHT